MNKAEIRPLLVQALEIAQDREANPALILGSMSLEVKKQEARLKRVQAEAQLWLADRQWEREERAAKT